MSRRPRYASTVGDVRSGLADYNNMTRPAAINELRRLALLSSTPVRADELPQGLWYALRRYFDSIEDARAAAGVEGPERVRRWSKEVIAAEITRLHRKGVRITETGLKDDHGDLLGAIT
jgi:hypothetical protein